MSVVLLALALAVSVLAAASLRLPSLVSTLLATYVALVANIGFVTVVLSPLHGVTRAGLAVGEIVLLALAGTAWWLRGRTRFPVGALRPAVTRLGREPVALAFVAVTFAVLAYELALVLTVPANNWDALTYHLARAAAWAQHGGLYWIPNAPSDRLNDFQPLAEQQILFFFVATGKGALYALPQFLAEVAILVAVYGSARRLGFDLAASACGAGLLATFSLFALESTTAQNDLVAAAFPAIAAYFLLGRVRAELALAGAAAGMGLGVKLTAVLVWPVLLWLLWLRGRSAVALAAAGAVVGIVVVGMWGYVLNLVHTHSLLGGAAGSVSQVSAGPSWPGSVQTGLHVLYRTLDLSVLSHRLMLAGAIAGAVVAVVLVVLERRPRDAAVAGLALASPLVVIGLGAALAWVTRVTHIPVHSSTASQGGLNRTADEDYSAFGPVGALAVLGAPLLAVWSYRTRRADARQLALATAFPLFLVLLALQSEYNVFLTRFLVVPATLTAPLFATLFRRRLASFAVLVAAGIVVGLTVTNDRMKPLDGPFGRPWQMTQAQAVELQWQPQAGVAVDYLRQLAPSSACLGAVMGPDEPSYLLYGPRLRHRIYYLGVNDALSGAYHNALTYTVVSTGPNSWAAGEFTKVGWRLEHLADYWLLVRSPRAHTGACV